MMHADIYVNLRRSCDGTVYVCSFVCLLHSLHSVSFGQLLVACYAVHINALSI